MSTTVNSGAEQREIEERDVSIGAFCDTKETYYAPVFERHQRGKLPRWHINIWGLIVPWFWAAWRGVWLMFWVSLAIDVVAIVCLMQVVKFSPLLAEAQLDPEANRTLIPRYTNWISTYGSIGWLLLVAGRIWMGSQANRWYYDQYNRWRIDPTVANGVSLKRLLIGCAIMLLCTPITTYRATQLRLDERACFNQIRATESVESLLARYQLPDVASLSGRVADDAAAAQSRFDELDAISDRTAEQNEARKVARAEARDLGRSSDLVEEYMTITPRDRFDCFFIDDFPTLARLDPPEDVTYRRVTGDDGSTEVVAQIKPPVEGRKVTLFTYSAESIDISINWLRASFAGAFDAMTNVLRQSLIRVEVAFMQTPWPVVAFLFLVLSWAYTGWGTTAFVASSLAFLALFELWQIAMQTMALVVVSTAVCVFVGLPIGIWMAKNKIARFITEPILDVMQTIPSLSYLVPAVAFFGISQPPAVLATVVFAMPPMIKLTALGIRQVPESTKEAALAFGASERQLLRKVELPMAVPSIMAGLNQTIMLALSMATISAFIGAEGLGAIVTAALGDAQAGKGLLAGIAIALVAMMIDRILRGIRNSFSRI
ncbi:ABC-type proline/glycine betaine transport system permease subunit [Shimia isoporae]|uniref:ABC-type proline/glycine betaine transport system permease subunit n=1 Tax=Shimia isoporae TaxID=647720 RepID=A0A4R1NAQ3_9RHOB|nr:ABC transporter permease subunit [Shimia isoporae]TCL01189.1 ABC-type proline/glycine betaine transport system permease subunit [Shimia isoporae]